MAAIVLNVFGVSITYVSTANSPTEVSLGGRRGTNEIVWYEEAGTLPPWNLNDPWFYRGYDYDPRADFKLIEQPKWLRELRQTPRRMKRPFPKDAPGPRTSIRRGAY